MLTDVDAHKIERLARSRYVRYEVVRGRHREVQRLWAGLEDDQVADSLIEVLSVRVELVHAPNQVRDAAAAAVEDLGIEHKLASDEVSLSRGGLRLDVKIEALVKKEGVQVLRERPFVALSPNCEFIAFELLDLALVL